MQDRTNRSNDVATAAPRAGGWMIALGVVALAAGASFYYQIYVGRPARAAEAAMPDAQVERGRYLVTILGCNDCHTPFKMTEKGPVPDMDRMLSGHPERLKLAPAPRPQPTWVWSANETNTAFAGPWGVTFGANLTPDKNTGLGIWDEKMFVQAMRAGKHFGQGRPIQPPMPWQAFGKMTDEDLKSVFAYLRTVPAVSNHVPDYQAPDAEK